MPFTLNTFTLEEQIAATQPTGKHLPTVSMILRDEESGWLNQPLKGNQTLHDYDVAQSKIDLADLVKHKNALGHVRAYTTEGAGIWLGMYDPVKKVIDTSVPEPAE